MMLFRIGAGLVTVETTWPVLRERAQRKHIPALQFEENDELVETLFIDGAMAYITTIYKVVPPANFPRTPAENSADLADFNAYWRDSANIAVDPRASSNVVAVAAAKGLGGYLPNPSNNPYMPQSDELVSLYVDGEGSLVTRGTALTDEGSFRNDFNDSGLVVPLPGLVMFTEGSSIVRGSGTSFLSTVSKTAYVRPLSGDDTMWGKVARIIDDTTMLIDEPYTGPSVSNDMLLQAEAVPYFIGPTPGTLTADGSKVHAASGPAAECGMGLWRQGDYGPMVVWGWLSVDVRRVEQESVFGFRDDPLNPTFSAEVVFDGADPTKIKFRTTDHGEAEVTELTLPGGATSAEQLKYRVYVAPEECTLIIGDATTLSARHDLHIPGPYDEMMIGGNIVNLVPAVSSTLLVDCVLFQNFNRIATKYY